MIHLYSYYLFDIIFRITSMVISGDNELLASGDLKGNVKV